MRKKSLNSSNNRIILAGDAGGTKTNLALCRISRSRLEILYEKRISSKSHRSLEAIGKAFLSKYKKQHIDAACIGVAGPIVDGCAKATNLPWKLDARKLSHAWGIRRLELLNDLEATAYGIEMLPRKSLKRINAGRFQRHGNIVVIAAGTGLGEAAMIWDGTRYRAVATEGGHADFAPCNQLQIDLLLFLQKRFGHVSYERILSGPGKLAIYQFLKEQGYGTEPPWLARRLADGDASATVSAMALNRRSPLCVKALAMFASIYGAEAGNLALKYLARGGAYIGGGIAPTILPKLTDGVFMKAFKSKGRFTRLLSQVPVHIILEDRTALFGAARYAGLLLDSNEM